MRRLSALIAIMFMVIGLTAACSSSPGKTSSGVSGVLIDVRTPEEFAQGHLQGAVNVPLQDVDFVVAVSAAAQGQSINVYCRSGNRSAQAIELLAASGVAARDLGGFQVAQEATGLPTVT